MRKPDRFPQSRAEARRRRVVATGVSIAGAGLLGTSLSSKPGSPQFYAWTLGTAATWVVGGLASGPLHLGWTNHHVPRRPVITPVLMGVGAFAVFYGCALASRRIPVLNRAIARVLRYAHRGDDPSVLVTTLVTGAAEEVFFRGAVYAAAGTGHPVAVSTAVYALVTSATRNPALVLASTAMGTLFGLQRRATGGIQMPLLTHLTWSALMLRFLPPLFSDDQAGAPNGEIPQGQHPRSNSDTGG
ncbi:MAG: CPBP family intramembrane metalloprotease [Actinomycetota bacterium]|nr:CPBP family intramembrane metalloprotease [Actinomycetota bacterium]